MQSVPLPDAPSLEQLRKQAKDLQRAVRAGEADALAEVAGRHPQGLRPTFPLAAAQLVLARRFGFASWARLKQHVETVERFSRFPDRMTENEPLDAADRFLRLACLTYEDDDPARWAEAWELLAAQPELTRGNVFAAAATADLPELRRIVDADPAAARAEGGPFRWTPLFYLASARHDLTTPERPVLDTARLLLDTGADPNAGYLWHGLPTPFTVLTGAFGEGELGSVRQPRHPHALALARLILEGGADPNDGQGLYNRMFEPDDSHLVLLFEFGLGTGSGGPWRARLGDAVDPPTELVRYQLRWAANHGMLARVALLADHGVDIESPFADGMTPATLAATSGHPAVVELLVARGATAPELDPVDTFIAAALAADRAALDALLAADPGLAGTVRAARPGLVVWAAANGRSRAVEILVEAGFDVNAGGRNDVPRDEEWETTLHVAAHAGDLDLARRLLRLGADPDVRDRRFDATPLGWAHHGDQPTLIELLEPLTAPDP